MDRSRFNRYHNVEPYSRPKPRYDAVVNHRRGAGPVRNFQDSNSPVTTSYRILCHDNKIGVVIGQSGSIVNSIRQNTGAWINVLELVPGDEERIIEISDTRRRDEGRMNSFSPAQEALFAIHERIIESDLGPGGSNVGFGLEEGECGVRGGGTRVVTRLVVLKMHVGSLLGKGGKIIEQMRMETKAHIRVLPRDHSLPKCVAMSEEIVQVGGDTNAVKHAIRIISSRLRESQHRDRINFHGQLPSPERFFPPHRTFMEEPSSESQISANLVGARGNKYLSLQSADTMVSAPVPMIGNSQKCFGENLVFRILCPVDKINSVVGESDGIIKLLQTEIGVAVKVLDPVVGASEQIIVISSEEGPDDELFPAQEALLHIQTCIVDLLPDKENIITTRLLVPSGKIGCLEGNNGLLSEMRKLSGVNVQILPNEKRPLCASGNDELLQIEGEIKVAREALVKVTSKLRSCLYQEYFQKETPTPPTSATSSVGSEFALEVASSYDATPSQETYVGNNPSTYSQSVHNVLKRTKYSGGSVWEAVKQTEKKHHENVPSSLNRFHGPLVTRSILEVVIPQYAVPKLISKSKNKLSQISELSGATVKLIEDGSEAKDNIVQISGTPEQAERAQSLLQGFILSTQEDGP
ncbi:RNA-binding KH domain-containing protein RCF3 [Heracleum sosnowskyi]|uniref:RNA-binding KH domain-containing protein RCF3 n=1 Tax=Heracleum sosnowskyi TaxID=360622 RepID=A0AAD8HH02_9APIA|nr:RNA-binding KH domain-containing protein RCF3 [Heracleum sosnowskyi]